MKISESWLRQWVDLPLTTHQLVDQLTMSGLEVDSVMPLEGLDHVVVAKIQQINPHPNADRLRCVVLDDGHQSVNVVCGAPNIVLGQKVPLACPGATLPNGLTIKVSKLRGMESAGMICSQAELGLADTSQGIWPLPDDAILGQSLKDYLNLPDTVIDIDLTPNRGDCLSIQGIARELAILNGLDWQPHQAIDPPLPSGLDHTTVSLEAGMACPRYQLQIIEGIDNHRPTPLWMQEQLRRCGIRSLNLLVDITNYVMLALGQPLHTFDANQLKGGVCVRYAQQGETLTLLDQQQKTLREDTLVIADDEQVLALAGIMGGLSSATQVDSTCIALESAFFAPSVIAGRARQYGLHTDSSHRFERGVDWQLAPKAMDYACQLIVELAGGTLATRYLAEQPESLPKQPTICLRHQRLQEVLGQLVDANQVSNILKTLDPQCQWQSNQRWQLQTPSHRFDLQCEEDLIEEVARAIGYQNIMPAKVQSVPLDCRQQPKDSPAQRLRKQLAHRGYQEIISYSFIDMASHQALSGNNNQHLVLRNPLSQEMSVMRTSLWPGLIKTLRDNRNHQQNRLRLFEIGHCFEQRHDGIHQQTYMAMLLSGERWPSQWGLTKEMADFFDLKGDAESLLHNLVGMDFRPARHSALHDGQTAQITHHQAPKGWIGRLHPQLQQHYDINQPVYLLELPLSLFEAGEPVAAKPLSAFPASERDIAMVVDCSINAQQIRQCIWQQGAPLLTHLVLFDVFEHERLGENKRSLGWRLTLEDFQQNLTEQRIEQTMQRIRAGLLQTFDATLRE